MTAYTEVADIEGQAPERAMAKRFAKRTGVAAVVGLAIASVAVVGLNGGVPPQVTALFAKVAPGTLGGALAEKAKIGETIGAADVAICTDETSTETADCWKDYGGVCMYEKKSCSEYGGTKNSTGCSGSDRCFCCQDIDSSLIGDDDAVLAWIDSFIGDDDKRASRKSSKGGKGGKSSH